MNKTILILVLISFGSALSRQAFSMDRAPDPRPQSQTPQIRDGFTGGIQVGNPSGKIQTQGGINLGATFGDFSGSAGISGNSWGGQNFNLRGSLDFREMLREIILEELGLNQ